MATIKTTKNESSVDDFIQSIPDETMRDDSHVLLKLMKGVTKAEPKMWGPAIIGFGDHRYRYENGREGDWFKIGFSPRKQALSLYLMCGLNQVDPLLKKLGKYKNGKGCLYIRKLSDVNPDVLKELLKTSVERLK